MGKASSKPKAPLDVVFSHFQDFEEATVVSAAHVKLEVPLGLRPFWILFSHFWDFRNLTVDFASLPCLSLPQESRLQ